MKSRVREWPRGLLSFGVVALLCAVSVACEQAPGRSEPYRIEIAEDPFRGDLLIEETTMRATRVRGSFVELPAGSYEAYFSSDACETKEVPVTLFMLAAEGDTEIELLDQDRRFSSLETGEHYLGIEAVPLDDSSPSVCIPLAP